MHKSLFFIVFISLSSLNFISCSVNSMKSHVKMSLIPPTAVTSQVELEVLGALYNDGKKVVDGSLILEISNGSTNETSVLDSIRVTLAPDSTFSYNFSFQTAPYVGNNRICLNFRSGSDSVVAERNILIEESLKRSRSTIDGAWIGLYHWSEIEGKHWNDDIRRLTADDWKGVVRSMHKAGMDIIVLQELFRNQNYVGKHNMTVESYPGKSFYPSELYPGRMPIECGDPVKAILEEASSLGMNVFMGIGLFAWFDFSEESLEWHKNVTREIIDKYGAYDAFYGFYVSEECVGSLDNCEPTEELRNQRTEEIISFFAEYKEFCSSIAPEKPVMLATNSMGITGKRDSYMRLLQNLDILCPFGFARMPENDISGYEAASKLQNWCDEAGCHLWFDLEAFLFNEDTSLYPRPIEGIIHDLNMFDNFEKVLCYQYPGVFNNPSEHPVVGDPRSVELYDRYIEYLYSLKTSDSK